MKLGIVYHMPFWQLPDGSLWEAEGSFGRYVDSLRRISTSLPLRSVRTTPGAEGTRIRARSDSSRHSVLDGPRQFYPRVPAVMRALRAWVPTLDVLSCRVPAWPPGSRFAKPGANTFRLSARRRRPACRGADAAMPGPEALFPLPRSVGHPPA
jgi:hypothetical protein